MSSQDRGLWHHSDFLKLWAGQSISTLGSGVTESALPLTAVLVLGAQASDMGWLLAVESAPVLLVGLFAGVWVDRFPRRRLLIGADVGRAVLLACIPLVAFLGALSIEHLYVVALAAGVLTVVFDIAYRSFVPDVVGPEHVLEANSRLASIEAVAEITTPGLTGALVQVIPPPAAILLDAMSFVGSALCAASIRHIESPRPRVEHHTAVVKEIADGLRAVRSSHLLSTLATWEAVRSFFGMFIGALYVLFGLRELGLSPLLVGLSVGVGGISNLVGTLLVERVTQRLGGAGRTMVTAMLVGSITPFLIALAPAEPVPGFIALVAAQSLDIIYPLYTINALTLRQVTTPPRMLGRVNATLHVVERGVIPFGALAGGMLGDAIGLRATLLIAAVGMAFGAVWAARSGLAAAAVATAPHSQRSSVEEQ